MKPITLVISGWGPYSEQVEIDFTSFQKKGLFLITGSTGAGKTTIFDAISYGLYGNVSGKLREKNSVRSDFSKPDTETFVELCFEHQEKQYRVRRMPKYQRPKKRGVGMISTNETAEFYQADKPPIVGVSEVNQKIEALMGIHYEQFKQIVMLAQGEFMDILMAESKDRSAILRKLFETEQYDRISKKLSEKSSILAAKIQSLQNKMEEAAAAIVPEESQELTILLQEKFYSFEKIGRLTKEALKQQIEEETEIVEVLKQLEDKSQVYTLMAIEREGIERRAKRILELEGARNGLLPELEESNRQMEKVPEWEREIWEFQIIENRLKEILPVYTNIEIFQKEKEQLEKGQGILEEKQNRAEEQEIFFQTEVESMKKRFVGLAGLEEKMSENYLKEDVFLRRKEALEELKKRWEDYDKERKKFFSLQKQYQAAEAEWNDKKEIFEKKEAKYRASAIGLAAKFLEEGKPCPICGSTAHPNKAEIGKEVPDEQEVRKCKEEAQEAQEMYHNVYEKAVLANGQVEQAGKEIKFLGKKHQTESREDVQNAYEQAVADWKRERKVGKHLLEQKAEKKELEVEIKKAEEVKNQWKQQRREIIDLLHENDLKKKEKEGQIFGYMQQLSGHFLDKKEAEKEKNIVEKKKQILEEQMKAEKEKNTRLKSEWYKMETLLEEHRKQEIEENKKKQEPSFTMDEIKMRQMEIERRRRELSKKKEELSVIIKGNERALKSMLEKLEEKKSLEKEYGVIKDLDKVTKGDNKKRIVFEQYILSVYFEQILMEANKRFLTMTSGRFELRKVMRVADARTKDYLGLEVMDYYTGKIRSIKTLSGGESFQAALSMALGLSDVVQKNSGGIRMETMFIDEGFGGLDTESLEQALKTLESLTGHNRLIGIISHVSELKDRIENQIVVRKDHSGSKIFIIGELV